MVQDGMMMPGKIDDIEAVPNVHTSILAISPELHAIARLRIR
jgi:hypothetical protein